MNKKHLIIICSGLGLSLSLSLYMTKNKHEEISVINKNTETNSSEKMVPQKPNAPFNQTKAATPQNTKKMTPSEYVAWVKDPNDRVLLEIKEEGTKIYRKDNVTITVMPDGEELYLPDEF